MFGYVNIDKQELKLKDYQTYMSYYCGLCENINNKFGILDRVFLSYDVTFFLLVLDALNSKEDDIKENRVGCSQKRNMRCSGRMLNYASFVNIYMVVKKLEDNYYDDNSKIAKILMKVITSNANYKRALNTYKSVIDIVDCKFKKLNDMEKTTRKVKVDELCVPFGEIIGELVSYPYRKRSDYKDIYDFGYYLGRIVYLIDAFDDYRKDMSDGSFNPMKYYNVSDEKEKIEFAAMSINLTYLKLKMSYSKLNIMKNKDIIDNVINFGIPKCVSNIANKQYKNELGDECDECNSKV